MTPTVVNLKTLREKAGLTQAELAERASTRQATISRLETGETRMVQLDVLDRIASALGVEPGDLIVREGKRR